MTGLAQDLRYAFRQLRRSPGFTTVALLTLALGVRPNTAIFSLIDAVMLKMLPVHEPEQLILLNWVVAPPEFFGVKPGSSVDISLPLHAQPQIDAGWTNMQSRAEVSRFTAFAVIAVSILSSYIPARRATKVDPMVALRYE